MQYLQVYQSSHVLLIFCSGLTVQVQNLALKNNDNACMDRLTVLTAFLSPHCNCFTYSHNWLYHPHALKLQTNHKPNIV